MTREPGFYWVRFRSEEWEAAQWDGHWFRLPSIEKGEQQEAFEEIGPRIYPPDSPIAVAELGLMSAANLALFADREWGEQQKAIGRLMAAASRLYNAREESRQQSAAGEKP